MGEGFRQAMVIPPTSMAALGAGGVWESATLFDSPTPYSRSGVLVCSSGMELESWPSIVWDVNWYYWVLGVHFRATRRQLADAYRDRHGEDDAYLTYVFSQLLNPGVRRAYDARPLGSIFWDKYVDQKVRANAQRLAATSQMEADEILRQWGYVDIDETADQEGDSTEVDIPQESGEDVAASPKWGYTFYMWRIRTFVISEKDLRLARIWQEAILAECHRHQVRARFAVGIMGSPRLGSDVALLSVKGATVLFVSTSVDTGDIERLAVIARNLLVPLRPQRSPHQSTETTESRAAR